MSVCKKTQRTQTSAISTAAVRQRDHSTSFLLVCIPAEYTVHNNILFLNKI